MSAASARPVVFIDSGVGGLPYYAAFKAALPRRSSLYVADRAHFPYGPKSREELVRIVAELTALVVADFDPALIVVACNSASVSALDALRAAYPRLPIVGTVPAVKPAALYSKKRRIGVLATERTVRDPYIAYLSERFAPDCALIGIAAPELVDFVEKEFPTASPDRLGEIAASYVERFRVLDVDAVVLGCTHFLFLAEQFKKAASDGIAIFDSREGVANRAIALLPTGDDDGASLVPDRLFVTGGEPFEAKWKTFASFFDLDFKGSLELHR